MSKTNNKNNVRDDEIDLLDLFRRMGRTLNRWGKSLGRALLITIVFLLKRWLPLGLSIILGIAASYLLKTTTESYYSSDMTLRSNAALTVEIISDINRLHTFCLENNSFALSNALSVNSKWVGNIIDISAFWIIDQSKDGIPDYV